ncbi:hypothetical protein LTR50_004930 [Elasticomyces elasticus]|nr:hypothetical protein LTR50_004930 [Elasticomyces elasticus]
MSSSRQPLPGAQQSGTNQPQPVRLWTTPPYNTAPSSFPESAMRSTLASHAARPNVNQPSKPPSNRSETSESESSDDEFYRDAKGRKHVDTDNGADQMWVRSLASNSFIGYMASEANATIPDDSDSDEEDHASAEVTRQTEPPAVSEFVCTLRFKSDIKPTLKQEETNASAQSIAAERDIATDQRSVSTRQTEPPAVSEFVCTLRFKSDIKPTLKQDEANASAQSIAAELDIATEQRSVSEGASPSPDRCSDQPMSTEDRELWTQDLLLRQLIRSVVRELEGGRTFTLECLVLNIDPRPKCCHPLCPKDGNIEPSTYYLVLHGSNDTKQFCLECLENLWCGEYLLGALPDPSVRVSGVDTRASGAGTSKSTHGSPHGSLPPLSPLQLDGALDSESSSRVADSRDDLPARKQAIAGSPEEPRVHTKTSFGKDTNTSNPPSFSEDAPGGNAESVVEFRGGLAIGPGIESARLQDLLRSMDQDGYSGLPAAEHQTEAGSPQPDYAPELILGNDALGRSKAGAVGREQSATTLSVHNPPSIARKTADDMCENPAAPELMPTDGVVDFALENSHSRLLAAIVDGASDRYRLPPPQRKRYGKSSVSRTRLPNPVNRSSGSLPTTGLPTALAENSSQPTPPPVDLRAEETEAPAPSPTGSAGSLNADGSWKAGFSRSQYLAPFIQPGQSLSEAEKQILAVWKHVSVEQVRWAQHVARSEVLRERYAGVEWEAEDQDEMEWETGEGVQSTDMVSGQQLESHTQEHEKEEGKCQKKEVVIDLGSDEDSEEMCNDTGVAASAMYGKMLSEVLEMLRSATGE